MPLPLERSSAHAITPINKAPKLPFVRHPVLPNKAKQLTIFSPRSNLICESGSSTSQAVSKLPDFVNWSGTPYESPGCAGSKNGPLESSLSIHDNGLYVFSHSGLRILRSSKTDGPGTQASLSRKRRVSGRCQCRRVIVSPQRRPRCPGETRGRAAVEVNSLAGVWTWCRWKPTVWGVQRFSRGGRGGERRGAR